jgi:hypothetical protein
MNIDSLTTNSSFEISTPQPFHNIQFNIIKFEKIYKISIDDAIRIHETTKAQI